MIHPRELFKEAPRSFDTPEEEITYLRDQLKEREQYAENQPTPDRSSIATEVLREHIQSIPKPENTNAPQVELLNATIEKLKPEQHDAQVASLYQFMKEHGLKTTFEVLEAMQNPHLKDDFHRFLVQYIISGDQTAQPSQELSTLLEYALFKIALPPQKDASHDHNQLIGRMDQFYAGMDSIIDTTHTSYTLEIALPEESDDIIFYVSVPREKKNQFLRHAEALFPNATINEDFDDCNVFHSNGSIAGAYLTLEREAGLPLRTYDDLGADPLDVILSSLMKLATKGEGACIQYVIGPSDDAHYTTLRNVIDDVRKGEKFKDAHKKRTASISASLFHVARELLTTGVEKPNEKEDGTADISSRTIEVLEQKLRSKIHPVNVRVITSAQDQARADTILSVITSSFNQFTHTEGNTFTFQSIKPNDTRSFIDAFIYRSFDKGRIIHLNVHELASVFHFPASQKQMSGLSQSHGRTYGAPTFTPSGALLGLNDHQGISKEVWLNDEDRMRHLYVIGQTGTGKTGLLVSMIAQDMRNGAGVAYIDPHGNDIHTILSMVPPDRYEDVIYFDPAYTPRPMGLNMLEFDPAQPEQRALIIDELMGIFNQLFDMQQQGGAMFQQYFKNAAMTVMGHPESGNTLLEITRVIAEKSFRDMKLQHVDNPIVRQFWINAENSQGEQSLANFVPYISSKFDPMISNEILRPVIVQEHSSFNIPDIINNKKILLVNLSKGRLGELNASLLGLILVGKIQMAALARANNPDQVYPPFYLYLDEFQNVTTPSIASILAEARKYKLSLTLAHQYLGQLRPEIKGAIMGNVGSLALFRTSPEDARELAPRIAPTFTEDDIINLGNRHAYLSMLSGGQPVPAFNMQTASWPEQHPEQVDALKQYSYTTLGRPREEVEETIRRKFELL